MRGGDDQPLDALGEQRVGDLELPAGVIPTVADHGEHPSAVHAGGDTARNVHVERVGDVGHDDAHHVAVGCLGHCTTPGRGPLAPVVRLMGLGGTTQSLPPKL